MTTVEKLQEELDYWIQIGIGDDIVYAPKARAEYQHLVKHYKQRKTPAENIPQCVLADLQRECQMPWYLRPTFWRILWIEVKSKISGKRW